MIQFCSARVQLSALELIKKSETKSFLLRNIILVLANTCIYKCLCGKVKANINRLFSTELKIKLNKIIITENKIKWHQKKKKIKDL